MIYSKQSCHEVHLKQLLMLSENSFQPVLPQNQFRTVHNVIRELIAKNA